MAGNQAILQFSPHLNLFLLFKVICQNVLLFDENDRFSWPGCYGPWDNDEIPL